MCVGILINIYNFIVGNTRTDTHEPVFESSSESDEEMEMQDWRSRFLRETYLDSIRVIRINLPLRYIIITRIL